VTSRSRRPPRPQRPLVPVTAAAVSLASWGTVAHNSGSGWVQALGAVVGGVLVVGLAGPAVAVVRARVWCEGAPTDGTVGKAVDVAVAASSRVRITPLDPPGEPVFAGPTARRDRRSDGAARPGLATMVLRPVRRGVIGHVLVEVASAAPFGLLWWTRRVALRLPTEVHVGPRLGAPDPSSAVAGATRGDGTRHVPGDASEVRGVRPYRPGDSRRQVHWPATAHTGALMVRETEAPAARPAQVVAFLPADPDAAERAAARALGTVVSLQRAGVPVVLTTLEPAGVRVAPVTDRRAASRRLARAVPGQPAPPPR